MMVGVANEGEIDRRGGEPGVLLRGLDADDVLQAFLARAAQVAFHERPGDVDRVHPPAGADPGGDRPREKSRAGADDGVAPAVHLPAFGFEAASPFLVIRVAVRRIDVG